MRGENRREWWAGAVCGSLLVQAAFRWWGTQGADLMLLAVCVVALAMVWRRS